MTPSGPKTRSQVPAIVLAASFALAALIATPWTLQPTRAVAQSAVHAPGIAPTHADDFSGIWISDEVGYSKTQAIKRIKTIPPYKPDWLERFRQIRAKANRGENINEGRSECLPEGMPAFLTLLYPIEFLMTPGQVTILNEYFNQTRRIFTDGRGHPDPDEIEPTFRGHSIGHWDGKNLVVDTVGIRGDTTFSADGAPHSDHLRVSERYRLLGPDKMEIHVSMDDPVALLHPLVETIILRRAPAEYEIREYVCEESQNHEKYATMPGAAGKAAVPASGPAH